MQRDELMEVLKLHSAEVSAQLRLNWGRVKALLVSDAALVIGAIYAPRPSSAILAALAVFVSAAGLLVNRLSHGYYRAARDRRRQIEELLGLQVLFGTTPGQRGAGGHRVVTVTRMLGAVFVLFAVAALARVVLYR